MTNNDPMPPQHEAEFNAVMTWLRTTLVDGGVSPSWVPGATIEELRRLRALGGLVGGVANRIGRDAAKFTPRSDVWITSGPVPDSEVVNAAISVLSDAPEEGLARIYANLVSPVSRRTLGTFFTNRQEVGWMLNRWTELHGQPASTVDVGAGVGIFTTAAAEAWPHSRIWSIDINPITLGLLSLQAALISATDQSDRITAIEADYTVWVENEFDALPGPRLILGNPPYTRLQLLPRNDRERLLAAAKGLVGSRASLSAIITAQSLAALRPEDGLCLLLPSQWTEADYARSLRLHLRAQSSRRIDLHRFSTQLFADATVDAVALLVGPESSQRQPFVVSSATDSSVRTLTDRGVTAVDPFQQQSIPAKGSSLPGLNSSDWHPRLDAFLTVRRGVATGANDFFVTRDSSHLAQELPSDSLVPLIRRLLNLPDTITQETLRELDSTNRFWLLRMTGELVEPEKAHIAHGVTEQLDARYLCAQRKVWHDLSAEISYPDLIIGQSTKTEFRIVENKAGAAILNNLYGLTWHPHVDEQTKVRILRWLRGPAGQDALRSASRTHATGLMKIEPKALSAIRVKLAFAGASHTTSGGR